jgi:hypothetical protein
VSWQWQLAEPLTKLVPYFDAALNEQCFQYRECGPPTTFIDAGKPV